MAIYPWNFTTCLSSLGRKEKNCPKSTLCNGTIIFGKQSENQAAASSSPYSPSYWKELGAISPSRCQWFWQHFHSQTCHPRIPLSTFHTPSHCLCQDLLKSDVREEMSLGKVRGKDRWRNEEDQPAGFWAARLASIISKERNRRKIEASISGRELLRKCANYSELFIHLDCKKNSFKHNFSYTRILISITKT